MNAYIYGAARYCEPCGKAQQMDLICHGVNPLTEDSDLLPQGPYADGGGPADLPCACEDCGAWLLNPLTAYGRSYLADIADDRHTDLVSVNMMLRHYA